MQTETEERQKQKRRGRGSAILIVLLAGAAVYLWTQIWTLTDALYPSADRGDAAAPPEVTFDVEQDTAEALRAKARRDKRYKPLAKHPEYYPEGLLRQVLRSDEVLDFALDYPANAEKDWGSADISLTPPKGIPHYLQWDARWGYGAYGSSCVGVSGCGPTCLSMAVVGLTGNTDANPLAVAEYADAQGWYIPGAGTDWELLRSGAAHYGLSWQELSPEQDAMCRMLDVGGCIIASMLPGDFTGSGHFILISGYDAAGFQVLDPNSRKLSRTWDFDTLKPQFAALWGYTA